MKQIKTVGVLTGGGDCPGLNAVIRSIVKAGNACGLTTLGIKNGFGGLVNNEWTQLTAQDVSGILPRGGTILGTTNRDNPFHFPVADHEYADLSARAVTNLQQRGVEALIVIGGDGSLRIADEFRQKYNLAVIAVPKTIDNDLPGTERTFGFDTAISIAMEALDRLHTTAESHHRVMILEVMGRYAGWIALHAGVAGGADCILLPEIPFRISSVINKVRERQQQEKMFSIAVVAEGARLTGGSPVVARIVDGSPDRIRLGGIGNQLAQAVEEEGRIETRCTVLGHLQRGGSPTAYDRILATRYGVAAVNAVQDGEFGCMMALKNNRIVRVPIEQVAGKPANIPLDDDLIRAARAIGVCFGD
ncbi:atp-dependent 6-phosphofructokinase [Lucifera butyrica]|uniref:ATP-dependent 6-phosphofructokinase n=1 Tax=Lucifera butyrica TaxID=1351585 RepID=A0A498R7S9_9FIRM|nr:ATP-dependent 6-phosphofructokinase [Lucifera butyrica]VBB06967.1 atp-dependent 6-phosphofructokinase [Lucifera butyrica]